MSLLGGKGIWKYIFFSRVLADQYRKEKKVGQEKRAL